MVSANPKTTPSSGYAGSVRVIHLRTPSEDTQGDTIITIDRSHPVLGNRHVLKDKLDHEERARVIAAYRSDLDNDFAVGGPMSLAVTEIARLVASGKHVALACHCAPLPCHGDVIAERVRQMVGVMTTRQWHRDGTTPQEEDSVFVFGSNLAGKHGKGAALHAAQHCEARYGIGYGPTGRSYALPTKDINIESLPLQTIGRYVADFLSYADIHRSHHFFVTRIGCGLAGFRDAEIAPLFAAAPSNCSLPEEWLPYIALPPHSSPRYAGIGSRETPPEVCNLMSRVAGRLAKRGYVLRSGGAAGADLAFESGAGRSEIYLPWRGFNGNESPLFEVSDKAMKMAARFHPNWSRLDERARLLMARNCAQILGRDLKSPAEFVVCWTPDGCESASTRSHRTGGTGQAIAIASEYEIPVFNLACPAALDRIKARIEQAAGDGPSIPDSLRPAIKATMEMFDARVAFIRPVLQPGSQPIQGLS